jgi:dienelactone hydrolase
MTICFACKIDPVKKQLDNFYKRNPKGTIVSSVICKMDMQQSYALYLPSKYKPENKYPVVICFDPHGDGSLPVNLLKEEAEKLDMVLVGSNNIRNGMSQDEIAQTAGLLMSDLRSNINIDEQRIYTAGFSGGARVALSLLFSIKNIRGVVACSGSIPASYIPPHVYIAGIGGTYDMNYSEMIEMEKGFTSDSKRHILFTFPGKHSWPPKNTVYAALNWLRIGEMKEKLVPVDVNVIERFKNLVFNDSLAVSEKYNAYNQIIQTLDGLSDVSLYKEKLKELQSNAQLKQEMADELQSFAIETEKQKQYQESFNSKPANWWKDEVKSLNKAIESSKSRIENALNKRLLAYISLYSFSACNYAKKDGDKGSLAMYVEIYGLADPQNPDYFYFLAYYNALIGNKGGVTKAIKDARANGFVDKQKITGDAVFTAIFNNEELQELLK